MTADPSAGAVPPEPDSASFDLLVEALGRWAAAAPAWPPGRRVQAAWADAAPRLEKARRDLARVLVVGVVGGTGTGKSTLVNALAGAEVSSAGDVARPTTVSPVVVAARDVDVSWLPLEALAARLVRSDAAAVASIVLIDCPDPDTQDLSGSGSPLPGRPSAANRNRDLLETVLPACDVLLLVSSAQKYRSWVVARELAAFAPGRPLLFVQTHASRDPDIRADWRRELEAQGFEVPRIFRVDGVEACARAAAGREQDAGFRELVAAIEAEFSGRQARRVRRTGALDLAAWFTRQAHGDLAASGAPLATLVAGCDAERRRLEAILGRAIGETLRGNRAAWQRLICDDVVARWHGGPFASFLHVIAALAGFWQRVRPATGLVGRLLAGQPLPSAAAGGWRALEELGLPAGEVEQSRSVLAGLATRAGMQEPLVGRARLDEAGTASATAAVVDRAGQWLATGIDRLVAERRRRIGRGAVHLVFEGAFLALLVTVLVRAGWNFFHGNLWEGRPVSGIGFLEESLVWVILWGLVLRWLVFALVRLGLDRDIQSLVGSLGSARLVDPLLHDFDAAGRAATAWLDEGARLAAEADRLARAGGETPGLGRLRGQPASPPVRDA